MSWLQLKLQSDTANAPLLEELMEKTGAISVTMADAADQPLLEPGPGETPLWQDILITGLYPENTDPQTVIEDLQAAFMPASLPPVQITVLEDQNWQRSWMDNFKPMQFGKRLWICPSWCEVQDKEAVNLMLDPGLAFGTGTHPTTALCLQWLDGCPLQGQTLVDYGCGSGILGMAALLLGARAVLGVDNDPQALVSTRENCRKNRVSADQFEVFPPEDFAIRTGGSRFTPVDGVMANILAEPLIRLSEEIAQLVKPGGWLLLSGILEKQASQVSAAYAPWFDVASPLSLEGWIRITAIRKQAGPAP
ncbi:MAG: 50S ribosomal protein L11 methyltransferase [Pseudohongiellaceae bacterium]